MSMNMMDLLKGQLGGMVAKQIGSKLGMDSKMAESAIGALLPTILGGLMKQASTPEGADQLDQTLQSDEYEGGMLDNISDIFSGDTDQVAQQGGGLTDMLFGDKVGGIMDIIGKVTGMDSGKGGSMLSFLLPLVMSFLGKQKRSLGLDGGGMANLLMSQKDEVAKAMPGGMVSALGLGDLGFEDTPASVPASTPSASPSVSSQPASGGGLGKLLIIPIIALLGFLGYKGLTGGAVEDMKGKAGAAIDSLEVPEVEIPDMEMPSLDAAGVTSQFKDIFGGYEETLSGITDEASAKAALPAMGDLNEKLGGMESLLGKLPEGVRDTVMGNMGTMLDPIKAMVEKVLAIPGVGPLLQPVVDTMLEKVKAITG